MFQRIRKSKITKVFSVFMIFNFLVEVIHPLAAFALTGGPSQPEVQSFQPIGITDMVDPFTGDYSYNIPLLDVGGYPINMIYNAGITMDQEASWVGLGWNINPGVITRNMRGVPDDFSGDKITQDFNMEPNRTYGISAGFGAELFGINFLNLSYSLGVNFNNYNGLGIEQSLSPSISAGLPGKESGTASLGLTVSAGNDGLNLSPSLSFSEKTNTAKSGDSKMVNVGASIGVKINSRAGLQALTIGMSGGPASAGKDPKLSTLAEKTMKKEFGLVGSSGGSTISLAPTTYVPQIDFARINTSISFSTKFGGTLFGADGTFNIGGYYSENRLKDNHKELPAYGYLNEQAGYSLDEVMLDFNREKDGAFTRSTPNLPVTNHTYDVFSINGQGIGGMFRPFRGDVGYLHDPLVESTSGSGTLGLELSTGNAIHIGADINVNAVTSRSGNWTKYNAALGKLDFQSVAVNDPYEPVYFKQAGEKTVDDDAFFASIGGADPVRIDIAKGPGFQSKTEEQFVSKYSSSPISFPSGDLKRYPNAPDGKIRRVKRNMSISYLTKKEARTFGVEGYTNTTYAKDNHIAEVSVLRTDGARYIYGISAYNSTQKEVSFNVSQNGFPGSCSTGLVEYSQTDASTNNIKGRDHYYNATTTPAYAHSYLLTSVLSPDYSDVDGVRGPSTGDLGSFTKFNYDVDGNSNNGTQPTFANYEWRTPYQSNKAAFNEGLKTLVEDDRASYVYGKKELWYLQNIETKTHIAIFHTSKRRDAYEAEGETDGNGSVTANRDAMFKLDSISLYSLPDYKASPSSATPIKRVHFRYDYTLCGDPNAFTSGYSLPNNSGLPVDEDGNTPSTKPNINAYKGKLTLKKVFFTYQKSFRGKISPYEFTYADLDHVGSQEANPTYNIKGYDRWGYFKPNPDNSIVQNSQGSCDLVGTPSYPTNLPAADFPYVEQNQANANLYSGSWSLTSIKLPSGGNIDIDYESDDYAYVQDRNAMEMIKVIGCGDGPDNPTGVALFNNSPLDVHPYLYFNLPLGVTATNIKEKLFKDLLLPEKYLYFRFLMAMKDLPSASNIEYVSGYSKIDDDFDEDHNMNIPSVGVNSSGLGYVRLDFFKIGEDGAGLGADGDDRNANPISKAAWNFCRLYNQRLAYGQSDPNDGTDMEDVLQSLVNSVKPFAEIFTGQNSSLRSKGFGQYFVPDKSWIRLYNPNGKKLGGGVRVRKLTISDNWDKMNVNYSNNTGNDSGFNYGQEYTYTVPDGTSSGVASYEPMPGGDENPFRQPVFFSTKHLLAPDDRNYQEEPFGESFFPAPGVGYSRVTVKNLQRTNVKKHATGYTVHEFYTAKDFPTLTDRTVLDAIEQRTKGLGNVLNIAHKDFMTASQGYVVETNDMHGKPKAQWVYPEFQPNTPSSQMTPISGVEYKYKTRTETITLGPMSGFGAHNKITRTLLDNNVTVIHKNKELSGGQANDEIAVNTDVGVDVDFVTDFREAQTNNNSFGAKGNLAAFLAAILPVAVPTVLPSYSSEKTRMRSAVTTKVINRYGILRETIAHDLGSQVSTQNLAWDAETGEVLLTKTKNNFNDEIYNFTYPAHWGYDRMGAAYQNILFQLKTDISANGVVAENGSSTGNNPDYKYMVKGDEVAVYSKQGFITTIANPTRPKAWVWDTNDDMTDGFFLVDKFGAPFTGSSTTYTDAILKVVRSGRRNMQNTPIGTVTSFKNPIASTPNINGQYVFSFTQGTSNIDVLNASMQEYSENWQTSCNETTKGLGGCYCTTDFDLIDDWNTLWSTEIQNSTFCDIHRIPDNYMSLLNTDECSYILEPTFLVWNPQTPCSTPAAVGYPYIVNFNGVFECPCYVTTFSVTAISCPYAPTWGDLVAMHLSAAVPADGGTVGCDNQPGNASGYAVFQAAGADACTAQVQINTCLPFGHCEEVTCPNTLSGSVINPYVAGIRGDWRPLRTHAFQTGRDQALAPAGSGYNNTSVRSDGKFSTYKNFWLPPGTNEIDWSKHNSDWTFASEVTEYSPFGFEIENKDALGRYSAAIYGYNNTLPKAVASNAGQPDIAFEGFEDYDPNQSACCTDRFIITNPDPPADARLANPRTQEQAHTGRYSFLIPGTSNNLITTGNIVLTTAPCSTVVDDMPYTVKECDLLHDFAPRTYFGDRDFIVFFWVKVPQSNNAAVFDYTGDVDLRVYLGNGTALQTAVETNKSDIIDGWQRIEERYTIHGTDTHIKIDIVNTGADVAFMDDIRVQPFNSSMKAFVYDPVSLRLWAELDERNFATFYEYDEDGALMRVKKETERGIMTIQESRNHTSH